MKSLHKKISAVALIAVLGAPVLSQGLVISPSLSSQKRFEIPLSEFQDYMEVKKYEWDYYYGDYYAIYLGSDKRKEPLALKYSDKWDFLRNAIKKRELKKYSLKEKPIFMKVGKSYFHVYFNLSDHQQQMMFMKEVAKHNSFEVKYASRNDFYGGYEFESHVWNRDDLKKKPEVVKKLLQRPNKIGVDKFPSVKDFVDKVSSDEVQIPHGYSRYSIGGYYYLFYNQY